MRRARKSDDDESLGSLLRRRLGDEATDLAVGPLLAGLYAGDVDRLSVQATFPELAAWERAQGSLFRGSQATSKLARRSQLGPMFVRPRGGVDRLPDALAERLGDRVRTGSPVPRRSRPGRVTLEGGEIVEADARRAHDPGPRERRGCSPTPRPTSRPISRRSPYASTGVVLMVYPEGTQAGLPDGTGFVVPRGKAPMTAATWLSSKWPTEAFGTRAVVRCYVGAVGEEDVLDADDADIVEACARHLAAVVPLPDAPEHAAVVRWPASMPQYEVGHLERVARLRRALPPRCRGGGPGLRWGRRARLRARGQRGRASACSPRIDEPSDHEETVP